jgi:hypothetical protein
MILRDAPNRPTRSRAWNGFSLIRKGAIVWHRVFGLGVVRHHDRDGGGITIKFKAHGPKVLQGWITGGALRIARTAKP